MVRRQKRFYLMGRDSFTSDISLFLKKLKGTKLYGGGDDGKESVHKAIGTSRASFLFREEIKAIMVFTWMRMEVMTMRNTHSYPGRTGDLFLNR